MSVPESDAIARLAQKYSLTVDDVRATVDKVQRALFASPSGAEVQEQVACVVSTVATVQTVVVSADFANVSYVETFDANTDEDVRREAVARMPRVLEAVFAVPGIERVRLTAQYPAVDESGRPAGVKRIGGLEASRSDFMPGKAADRYDEFWVSGA